jgi:transcriptional regulator with XRE-family HTH domain
MSQAAGAADFLDEHGIAEKLRELRTSHRYSMRKLASIAGVSTSLISDVERGRVEPSISVLKRLAHALDVNLTYFFSEGGSGTGRIVRAAQRRRIRQPLVGRGIEFELLGPDTVADMEPVYGRYDPGASMGTEPISHEGEEWGIVIRGRLKVWVGDEIYFLEEGDTIWFPSTEPHRMANALLDGVTEYIWVNSKRSF